MNGIQTHASMAMMVVLAIHGSVKKAGFSQPSCRAKLARGPNRFSINDLPIIQLTATGLSMRREGLDAATGPADVDNVDR